MASQALVDYILDEFGVRLVADFKHVVAGDFFVEAGGCRLEIVKSVSHVAFSCEDQSFNSLVVSSQAFKPNNFFESLENFNISEFRIPDNCTSTLYRLNQFAGVIAGKSKSCRCRKFSHDHSQSLLSRSSKGISLIQNDYLVHALGHNYFLVRK